MLLHPKVTRVVYKSDDEEKHSWKKDMNIAGVKGQKSEQKPTTKNFVGFHNHSPLLTLSWLWNYLGFDA